MCAPHNDFHCGDNFQIQAGNTTVSVTNGTTYYSNAVGLCPGCGRCNTCGRGPSVPEPAYIPNTLPYGPHDFPYVPTVQPIWIVPLPNPISYNT